jgi:hypothetical protein
MAQAWEQYEFIDLKFCYYTRTGTNVPGSLMMAFDDAADAAPASEQVASSYEGVVEDAPWKDITCFVRKVSMAGSMRKHYTRSGPLASNLDIKTYDVGKLHLITLDGTAVPWGKLWVEYDIIFNLPQLPPTGVVSSGLGGSVTGAGTLSGANPMGTAPVLDPESKGISIDNASVLTFSTTGSYVLVIAITGTVMTAVAPTFGAGIAIVAVSQLTNSGGTATLQWFSITVNDPSTATCLVNVTATTVTASSIAVGQAPDSSLG